MQSTYTEITEERADASRVGRVPRDVDYLEDISSERARVRARFTIDGGIVVRMTVQLEIVHGEDWKPARRYDDTHDRVHLDVLDPEGNEYRKVWLDISRNEALTFALRDFYDNWERYANEFLGR
jgi:hypothetical protein